MMELKLLHSKMNITNKEVEEEMGNDEIPFSKVIFAITSSLSKEELFTMSDEVLLRHIRKVQLIEGK